MTSILSVAVALGIAFGAMACTSTSDGQMNTSTGRSFAQSIWRHAAAGNIDDALFSCDLAEASLSESRNSDLVEDWIELIDPCYDLRAGETQKAIARLNELRF